MKNVFSLVFYAIFGILLVFASNGLAKYSLEYLKIGSCPCDITPSKCDIYCCCDPDCENIKPLPFSCSEESLKGANFPDQNCNSTSKHDSPDWKPFLCLQSEKTPYLGHFFHPPEKVSSAAEFESAIEAQRHYTAKKIYVPISETFLKGYKQGKSLKMEFESGFSGFASLPTKFWNGQCIRTSPLRYLKTFDVNCVYSGSLSACGGDNVRTLDIDPELYGFSDIPSKILNMKTGEYVNMKTICLKSKIFLKTGNNPKIYFNTHHNGEELVDCNFGDLYPKLSLNSAKNVCTHSVKSVTYDFHWKGTELLNLTSTIVIVDAAPPILQNFAVNFLHENESSQLPVKFFRSGVFGYDVGRPVIAMLNGTEKYLQIWRPGRTGDCSDVRKAEVLFGIDSSSGCMLHLSASDFKDCNRLREIVRSNQSKLFEADSILTNGNPTSHVVYKVLLLKSNITAINNISATGKDSWKFKLIQDGPGRCGGIPNEIVLEVLYADAGHVRRQRVDQIVGSRIKFRYSTWSLSDWNSHLSAFPVISTVSFIKVPLQRHKKVKKFWDYPNICEQDICWEELWYPDVYVNAPYEMISNTLLCLMFAIPCLWIFTTQLSWQK